MEIITIMENSFDCELTQLEGAIKTIREIVGEGDCWIACETNRMRFIDDYGDSVATINFE